MTNKPTAGSVYLSLTPALEPSHICIDIPTDPKGFIRFLTNNYDDLDRRCGVPDNYLIRYDFADSTTIPSLSREGSQTYLRDLLSRAAEQKIHPSKIVSLLDLVYCRSKQIPWLTPLADHAQLRTLPMYDMHIDRLRRSTPLFPTLCGIETDQGVMLFSDSDPGREMMQKCLQYHADMFYKPSYQNTVLRIHSILPFAGVPKEQIDRFGELQYVRSSDCNDFCAIPSELYAPREILHYGICQKEYDMHPLAENFGAFIHFDSAENLSESDENYDLSALLSIRDHGYPQGGFYTELPRMFFRQEEFDRLDDSKRGKTETECAPLEGEIRKLASQIISQVFYAYRGVLQKPLPRAMERESDTKVSLKR